MNEPTTLTVKDRPSGLRVIHIHGDLDSMGSRMIEGSFSDAIDDRSMRVIVEVGEVTFISSAGLAMLLVKGKALREGGGNLSIASASDRVHEVLMLAGFQDLFGIYPTLDEALAALEDT
jgi:anti-sigma B factor antagonist